MKLKEKYNYQQLCELNRVKFNGFLWGLITGGAWVLLIYNFILLSIKP